MTELIITDLMEFEKIAQALSNKSRLKIINLLKDGEYNINEIAKALQMPVPTVTVNIKKLIDAGIVDFKITSGKHGMQKICSLKYSRVIFDVDATERTEPSETSFPRQELTSKIDIPLKAYVSQEIHAPCGLADRSKFLSPEDDESSFEKRYDSVSLLWFGEGKISFPFNVQAKELENSDSIKVSFEGCSQHLFFEKIWPSDVTLWINGYEIGTVTTEIEEISSIGKNTPKWWPKNRSQHGELLFWEFDKRSPAYKSILSRSGGSSVELTIGIKSDAPHSRGIMIFGRDFGNYSQDILVEFYKTT